MTANVFRFEFEPSVVIAEAELTLHLATYAVEGLYGEARVRLEAAYRLDESRNDILVDGGTEVGAALVKVFTRLLLREFGQDGFHVRLANAQAAVASSVQCPGGSSPEGAGERTSSGV